MDGQDLRKGLLSVVAPAMNEEGNIAALAEAIDKALSAADIPYELIIVDDGSRDGTWDKITAESISRRGRVRGAKLSRNFGKESAMFAGLSEARGKCAAIIDADLQFPPSALVEMYAVWRRGEADIVIGKKLSRGKEGIVYKLFTKVFYGLLDKLSGMELNNACDFMLLDRKALAALDDMPERITFFRAMTSWLGFKRAYVPFEVAERNSGRTKFSTKKLIKYALNNIASFSSAPMQLVTGMGVLNLVIMLAFALIAGLVRFPDFTGKLFFGIAAILCGVGGIIMSALGIIGFYLAKIYDEVKFRPRFVIAERSGADNTEGDD